LYYFNTCNKQLPNITPQNVVQAANFRVHHSIQLLQTSLHYFIWILLRPRVMRIILLLIPSHVNSASSAAECQAGSVTKVAAIHKIVHSWQDIILCGCDKDKNQHCTKFLQVCWKVCEPLQVHFTALHPEHHLNQATVLHILHSPGRRNLKKYVYILICVHVIPYDLDITVGIPLRQPYHLHGKKCIKWLLV
jgi:hypothetical protein